MPKKVYKTTPTFKQKKALEKVVENSSLDKPKPIGEILMDVGYSKATAIKPTQVTRSKGFVALMEKMGITDERLIKTIDQGLEANRVISAKVVGKEANENTDDFIEVPDHQTRHKFLETGLRLKGYGKEVNTFNFSFINQARDKYE